MTTLEQTIAAVLDQYDRVDFGRWRHRVNNETILSPLTTDEVAHVIARAVVHHRREAIARALNVSTWTIQKLFEEDDT